MGLLRKAYDAVVDYMSAPLNAQADRLGIKGPGPRNAFTHALKSAQLSYDGYPRILGALKEEFQFNIVGNEQRDYYKDTWNNSIGADIGDYAKSIGVPADRLPEWVKHAMDTGQLIIEEKTDSRVPKSVELPNPYNPSKVYQDYPLPHAPSFVPPPIPFFARDPAFLAPRSFQGFVAPWSGAFNNPQRIQGSVEFLTSISSRSQLDVTGPASSSSGNDYGDGNLPGNGPISSRSLR